jgi:hypothetical protein
MERAQACCITYRDCGRLQRSALGDGAGRCHDAPCADWTLQQLREVIGFDDTHRYLIHDRDRIFARRLNESIEALGVNVLKSPLHSPKANAICERVIGKIRRECLDWLIPLSEAHLRSILTSWVEHYNRAGPHSSLGPGVPDPPGILAMVQKVKSGHRLGEGVAVLARDRGRIAQTAMLMRRITRVSGAGDCPSIRRACSGNGQSDGLG